MKIQELLNEQEIKQDPAKEEIIKYFNNTP